MAASKKSAKRSSAKKRPAAKSSRSKKSAAKAKAARRKPKKRATGGLGTVRQVGQKTWKTLKSTTAQVVEGVKETFGG